MTHALANTKQHMCAPTSAPPWGTSAPSTRPRSPAQLTSFCPAPLGHLGKPANGLRGREIQRSTSCNPRILQGRGMFDGKAFLLGEGFSRGGSLFSIIFKLWYKRTPLTGKPRHERPPLPPQICLGYRIRNNFWQWQTIIPGVNCHGN